MNHFRAFAIFKRLSFLGAILVSSKAIVLVYSPLLILLTTIGVAIPFATGCLIDALACRSAPYTSFVLLSIFLLSRASLTPILQSFINLRSRDIEQQLQFRVLNVTMNYAPSKLATLEIGQFVAKLTRDVYAVGGFVRGLYPRILQAFVMMIAAGIALFSRSSLLAITFVVFIPLVILLFIPFAHRFSITSHRVRTQSDRSFNALFGYLLTLPFLRTLGAERRFADTPKDSLNALKGNNNETDSLSVRFGFLLGFILVIGEIIVLGIAGNLAMEGHIPVGDVVLYQMLFLDAIQSVQGVICLLPELATLREGIDSIAEVFEKPQFETGKVLVDVLESITFSHVTFAYQGNPANTVIRDFSATFTSDAVVGLEGANGTGKSTLLKLAINALEPQSGRILINGLKFNELYIDAFRRRVGVVFQDMPLIAASIRDNITLRDSSCTSQDVNKALALSGFDSVVKRLPEGLDTQIGNCTSNLSGGERQRLAIARAIVRDPCILVFDEPMNHLDEESRRNFKEVLLRLRPGRLIFLADHDGKLKDICDVIVTCKHLFASGERVLATFPTTKMRKEQNDTE